MRAFKETRIYFIAALLVIIVGFQFIQYSNHFTGASISKTTISTKNITYSKSVNSTNTTSTQTSSTTTPSENPKTTDTSTKTFTPASASKISTTTDKNALAGEATTTGNYSKSYNQTPTNNTANITITKTTATFSQNITPLPPQTQTAASPVPIKPLVASPFPLKPTNITNTIGQVINVQTIIYNAKPYPVSVSPLLKVPPLFIPYEEKIRNLVEEQLRTDHKAATEPEFQQTVQQKVDAIKTIEQEKVQPLYIQKVYHPLETLTGLSVSSIKYTQRPTSGKLLFPQLANESTLVQPAQSETINVTVRAPLSREGQSANIILVSEGQEIASRQLTFAASGTGTAIDLDSKQHLFDVYLLINPKESNPEEKLDYYLELSLAKDKTVKYVELFGPYHFTNKEISLFSQQFSYDPQAYWGKYVFTAKIFQNTHLLTSNEFPVELN